MSVAAKETILHFELRPGKPYTLKAYGGRYDLQPHTEETRRRFPELDSIKGRSVTHFAEVAEQPADTIQLLRVYGPPDANGIPTLESLAVSVSDASNVYTTEDLANALLFLHPSVTVLTAESAPAVQQQIAASQSFGELTYYLQNLNEPWNTSSFATDSNGNQIPNPYTGSGYLYQYDLNPTIETLRNQVAGQAIVNVNNDPSLNTVRYNVANGVPYQTATAPADTALDTGSGYNVQLQDPGPNYGISAQIASFSPDNGFTLSVILSNSYVRHCSAFVSFLSGDGKTAIVVPDNWWTTLAKGAVWAAYEAWLAFQQSNSVSQSIWDMLFDDTNTLKYLGTLSPETTFLGVPTSQGSAQYTFSLPVDQSDTVGKIRLLVGSLGLPSGND